ncbi:hypothetical protein VitviT2T_012447 [Vitis vinifera]|uniref:Uncharacterized protein n=2 Tax=Vitis vinifera TaxID=29760 RepID=D7TH64_VITVI|eukprot:XP_003632654.1 PREDICTED: uncharacterized protein LOC100259609 [Vitis vinifera]
MIGLSKLCIVLIVVFAVFLLVIGTQLFHVYWYRKRFRRQNSTAGHPEFPGDPFSIPSKELLYFFCWKRQSRIEPHADPHAHPATRPGRVPSEEINDVDVLKWQGLYGSSRVLFTIKEEEREEMEPQATDKSLSAETKSVSLGECLRVADELPELTVAVGVDEVTPFSTPCASPPYFTPSPSPTRDVGNGTTSPENVEIGNLVLAIKGLEKECSESDVSSGSKFSFVSLEVHSD